MQKRILSGITPSSAKGLHLGNYLGAVKPHIEFQEKGDCFYFIANLHALNNVFDPEEVHKNTMNIFIEYLAFGLDPEKTTFYIQSDIHSIPYLQTILNNAVTVAELKRMHAYKDKLQNDVSQDAINFGLFSYPVLMAADILAFNPDVIPVGEDQTQHVEICRDIARTFNNRYGDVLKVPELFVKKDVARVPGIDGQRKMSKSLGNDIPIFASEDIVKKQIMSVTTDPARIHPTDPGDPDKNVAFTYLGLMEYERNKLEDMKERYKNGTIGDVEIKKILLNYFLEYFADMKKRKEELQHDMDRISELRKKGAEKANLIAEQTLREVKDAVGVA
ncbi:tryptophan--tRNA ligase [Candidatus Roizmanbacteria bacterium]|nr:MAG: tryptophan--tRNA ligase [Candidatus Roizmanbacteria bacterium]